MHQRIVRFASGAVVAAIAFWPSGAEARVVHGATIRVAAMVAATPESSGIALLGVLVLGVAAIIRRRT